MGLFTRLNDPDRSWVYYWLRFGGDVPNDQGHVVYDGKEDQGEGTATFSWSTKVTLELRWNGQEMSFYTDGSPALNPVPFAGFSGTFGIYWVAGPNSSLKAQVDEFRVTWESTSRFEDDFNGGAIAESKWIVSCDSGLVELRNDQVHFQLKENKGSEWQFCMLQPQVPSTLVRKVSWQTTFVDGKGKLGWIGLYGHCGSKWLNLVMSTAWVGFGGEEITVDVPIEIFGGLPVSRTLIAEWTGQELTMLPFGWILHSPLPEVGYVNYR